LKEHKGENYNRLEVLVNAWKNAMASAFQSPKLGKYLDRLKALDGRVALVSGGVASIFCFPRKGWVEEADDLRENA
jgi:hypothetical protein